MQQVSTTTDKGNLLGGIDNCSSAWYKGLESFGQQVLVAIFSWFQLLQTILAILYTYMVSIQKKKLEKNIHIKKPCNFERLC